MMDFQRSSYSYAVNAMEKEKGQVPEPWKDEEVRILMRLSRLRVGLKAAQLLMFGWNSTKDSLPTAPDENLFFPQYVPTRAKCPTPSFTVTWVRKVTTIRAIPPRIRADPPPLTTGLLWGMREQDLADPYRIAAGLFGSDAIPDYKDPQWLEPCSALGKKCSLCPEAEATRLVPCCACENWVHLECSYGIPEGRLCASRCQIIDPLKGVVVTDFNCPRGELRCLVPWRPWAKKNKVHWERQRPSGNWGWNRKFYEMIPNWALEKRAWLGAGLIWKRVHASACTNRQEEEEQERQKPKAAKTQEEKKASGPLKPWKALPLILPWDNSYKDTYHTDFGPSKAHGDLSWRCPLTSLADTHYNDQEVMYGIVGPDRPWMLSPPELPVAGATDRNPDEVKVMVYHGLTYSHSGLTDPSVRPGYVAVAKHKHEQSLRWTGLEPELPKWSEVSGWFENWDWDLGKDMQAYARPDGAERSMVYDAESKTWNARPRELQPVPKKKAKGKPLPKRKAEKKEVARPKRKLKHGSTTSKGAKDENREAVNVKPKDSELDVEEDDAPVAEETPPKAK